MPTNFNDRKFLIFDLDGTLIDSNADLAAAMIYAATTVGGVAESEIDQALLHSYMGKGLHETFGALLPPDRHNLMEEMIATFRAYYRDHSLQNTVVFPGALALLEKLKDAGKLTAIATTKYHPNALHLAEELGLTPFFDFIQGTPQGEWPLKPDPHILKFLMKQAGCGPADTLMVGDTDNDVLCAHRAEMPVIAVTWGAWPSDRLQMLRPAAIVESFDELAGILL